MTTKIKLILWLLVLALLLTACTPATPPNTDGGNTDSGNTDSGNTDSGNTDNGNTDSGSAAKDPYSPLYAPADNRTAYTVEEDHGVLGEGIGVFPGRVVWEYDENAFNWNGSGYWCMEKNYDVDAVNTMVSDGLCSLAGEDSVAAAWNALFENFNWRVNGTDGTVGYTAGEKIVIKCNMNGLSPRNAPTVLNNQMFTPPVLLRALLLTLVEAGVAPHNITVFDASRVVPTYMQEMCSDKSLKGVNFVYNARQGNIKQDAKADLTRPILWSARVDAYATETYYPTCVTEADYMINLSSMKPHTLAGFTASAKNHFGTIMPGLEANGKVTFPNDYRDNPPTYAGLHPFAAAMAWNNGPNWTFPARPMGSYTVLTDLLSNADSGGKTVLYMMDALAVSPHQGGNITTACKWETFGGKWTNSVFFSQDPVAIDSVAYDFISAEDAAQKAMNGGDSTIGSMCLPEGHTAQNYLHEAALAYAPPSGTYYHDGYGNYVTSLGTHEHWNNPIDRQYSRNLGLDKGIELLKRTHQ